MGMSQKELGLNPGYNKCQSYDQELNLSPLSLLLVYKDNKSCGYNKSLVRWMGEAK